VTRPRVLVADDHAGVRAALVAVLDLIGLEVVGQASDGAEAVAPAEELAPDLVVMDLSMPVLNGLDATRLLREAAPATAVVVFTAFASGELEDAAHAAGAAAYVVKDTTTTVEQLREVPHGAVVTAARRDAHP
jgi:DNA-binding NarL/FixJ family response regulator